MIGKFFRALFSGIGITLMVTIVLSLLLWFLGSYLGFGETRPFETFTGQLIGLAILWILALIIILLLLLRGKRADESMADDIVNTVAEDPGAEDDEMVKAELGEMKTKLKSAMTTLRKSKLGRGHLYQLPWYVMIGPPGAGKTTAIINSGLNFPLAGELGDGPIGGVGGTRNCDWWFTNDAVLVDTAGRYTTQDSDAETDNAAWLGFLKLLKKHRKRQPINGAIVAISLSDLAMQDAMSTQAHAAAVRRRLQELRGKLGVRFPVYVLFTKADLIAGFTEFFDRLGKEERGQVWGFTMSLPKGRGQAAPAGPFDEEFTRLIERLNAQSVDRMQEETDPQRRALISGFPSQVASLRGIAREFLDELFQDNRFEDRQLLRGVYFTSGTQEGTPIDRLMMGMAKTFGIGRQAIGSGSGTGRSFFLTRLFTEVMFPEAGLVSADDKVERRYRWTRRAAFAATFIAAISSIGFWVRSYMGNSELIEQTEAQIASYKQLAEQIPRGAIEDTDLRPVSDALNILRDLPSNPATGEKDVPSALGFGLSQAKVLGNEEKLSYRAALNQHLLPRLLLRLEDQMQGNINNPDVLYDALKSYLMLGQAGPMNSEFVQDWITADWLDQFPGVANEPLREDLTTHLASMLDQPMAKIGLNNDVVEFARSVLTELPAAQRIYNSIISSDTATELPKFRLTDHGGPNIARAFQRASGAKLNEGVPGIFTYEGFHGTFLIEALGVASKMQAESFILGDQSQLDQSEASLLNISRDVLALYYTDFVAQYDALLGDIDILPMPDLATAADITGILSGASSPISNVLLAVAKETRLTEDRTPEVNTEGAQNVAKALAAGRRLSTRQRLLLEALSQTAGPGGTPEKPGEFVEKRFTWLHKLVEQKEGQPSELDGLISELVGVQKELTNRSFLGASAAAQAQSPALQQFRQSTSRLEGPLRRWAQQISVGSADVTAEGTRSAINETWAQTVLPFCTQATANAYPFNRKSRSDISIQDFTTLFAPDGLIDKFFNENLAKFIDTSTNPWSLKKNNPTDLGISETVLRQMQHAATIRTAFFPSGPVASVPFEIANFAMAEAKSLTLEIDGQVFEIAEQDTKPRPLRWPGNVGFAAITLNPPREGSTNTFKQEGPWAFFRLLDAIAVRKTSSPDLRRLNMNIGGRLVVLNMRVSSVRNAFSLPSLKRFKCPKSF